MNKNLVTLAIAFVVLIATVVQAYATLPQLSERVLTHFGASGSGDSWSTKEGFFRIQVIVPSILLFFLGGTAFLIPRLPASMVNLPNKEYWLKEENRKKAFQTISFFLNLTNIALQLFFFFVNREIINTNLERSTYLGNGFWIVLGTFMVFSMVSAIWMLLYFSNVPKANER